MSGGHGVGRLHRVCATAFAVLAIAATAGAADGKLVTTVAAGLNLTDGNSETMRANASLVTEGERAGLGAVRAGAEANYGESTVDGAEEKTVDNAKAFANARRDIGERFYGYLDGTVAYDDIAEIDYRATAGPGLGRYLVRSDATKLTVEAGVSYVFEEVAGESADYAAMRAAERFDRKLSETARLWQSVEYVPEIQEFGNYLLTAELGAEAALNSRFNLRVVVQDKYDSDPGAGLEENDVAVTAGVSAKL